MCLFGRLVICVVGFDPFYDVSFCFVFCLRMLEPCVMHSGLYGYCWMHCVLPLWFEFMLYCVLFVCVVVCCVKWFVLIIIDVLCLRKHINAVKFHYVANNSHAV